MKVSSCSCVVVDVFESYEGAHKTRRDKDCLEEGGEDASCESTSILVIFAMDYVLRVLASAGKAMSEQNCEEGSRGKSDGFKQQQGGNHDVVDEGKVVDKSAEEYDGGPREATEGEESGEVVERTDRARCPACFAQPTLIHVRGFRVWCTSVTCWILTAMTAALLEVTVHSLQVSIEATTKALQMRVYVTVIWNGINGRSSAELREWKG